MSMKAYNAEAEREKRERERQVIEAAVQACLTKARRPKGVLEVGTSGLGEVVVNHPDLEPDAQGVGHIVFSPSQARSPARILLLKADEAEGEK
jgi:hypothetical protein